MFFFAFPKPSGKKQQITSRRVFGRIASANDHKVILKLSGKINPYREGQRIIVSIPNNKKSASGKVINVSEVVAYGKITNISQDAITIHSKLANPIISKSAIYENLGEECVVLLETIDEES